MRFIAIGFNLVWETGAISTRFDEPAHTATAPYASRRAIGLLRRDTECIESGANMRSFQGEEETQKPDWANARDVPNSTLGSNSRGLAAQVIPLFAKQDSNLGRMRALTKPDRQLQSFVLPKTNSKTPHCI